MALHFENTAIRFGDTTFDYVAFDPNGGSLVLHVLPLRSEDVYDTTDELDALNFQLVDGHEVLIGMEIINASTRAAQPGGITVTMPNGEVIASTDATAYVREKMATTNQ